MKINIKDEGKKINIGIPTGLVMNYFSATFAPLFINRKIKNHGMKVTVPMCWKFVRAFNKTKKHFGGKLEFLEAETPSGTSVSITL